MKLANGTKFGGILAILALLAWLLQQSNNVDTEQHVRTIEHFRQIKQLDATLNQYVLQSRYDLLNNYDPIVQTRQQIDSLLADIEHDTQQHFPAPGSPVRDALASYRDAITNKGKSIEGFKSHNAVFKNSLHYFPKVVYSLLESGKADVRRSKLLHNLLDDVLLYSHAQSSQGKELLTGQLSTLLQLTNDDNNELQNLARHIAIILSHKSEIDDQIQQIMLAPTSANGDKLFHLYNQQFMLEEERAARYKQLLALLALALVGYVTWAMARLNKTRNELRSSLAELEFQKYALDQHSIVSIADRSGLITYTNDKFSEVSQYSREELLGQDHRLLNSGYHPHEFFREMWQTIGRGKVWHAEVKNRRKDGSFYWVDSTIVPFMDAQGKPSRYVSIRSDITERKAMEQERAEQREFYERISETLGEGLYVQDANGCCIYMNSEAEILLGWPRTEFIGKSVHNTIHTQTAEGLPLSAADCTINKMTRAGLRTHSEDQVFVRRDGSTFPVAVVSQGIFKEGKYHGAVVAFQDITLRKEVEATMQAAKEAAEEASRAKSDFLANMSHEIRTPMNGIIGMTELALDTELTPEQKEYLGLVKSSADALLDIVNDILDFSKIEAGKMEIDNIDFSLQNMLSQTTRSIALRAHQKGLELLLDIAPDIPEMLVGDPGRLRQIVINLVGNAIKFTSKGEIMVRASMGATQSAPDKVALHISVHDTGIGIPANKLQSIFESFSQADSSTTRKYGGTGLGLTISTRLVELMQGRIWVESEVGKGSTFHIEVTLDRSDTEEKPFYEAGKLTGMRVLVVDDNATNRGLAVELLKRWKMQPHTVENGLEAIAELERASRDGNGYQLILLDVQMPRMDGFAVVEHLRMHPELTAATIMMLTSEGQRGDAARCRELGVSAYLLKPFSQSDLFDSIMNTLGLSGVEQAPLVTRHSIQQNRRSLYILLAEDNPVNQTLAVRLLNKFGHTVEVAGNGLVALEKWESGNYDVILMDVDMPELNGFGATARIRELEQQRGVHTPIIGLTAHVMQGSREECLAAGMDGYISKPIDTEALWIELESVRSSHADRSQATLAPANKTLPRRFELDKALSLMDNDMDLFREMARIYMADYPGYLEKLGIAIEAGDAEKVRYLAHTIKGMLAVFGVPAVAEIADRIEMQPASDHRDDYIELQDSLVWLSCELNKAA